MTATRPPNSGGYGSPPAAGWYDDPTQPGTKRYWDGAQWTQHVAPASSPGNAVQPPAAAGTANSGGLYGVVRRRPALALWATAGIALVLGVGIGAASMQESDKQESSAESDRVAQLESELEDAKSDASSAQSDAAEAEAELGETKDKLSTTRDKLRDARSDAAAMPPASEPIEPADDPEPSGGSGSGQSFSGNGSKNIGTIEISEESVLEWTNDGELFQMWDADFGLHVNSQGDSGDTVVAPGTYTKVEVNALGNWTIEIRPR